MNLSANVINNSKTFCTMLGRTIHLQKRNELGSALMKVGCLLCQYRQQSSFTFTAARSSSFRRNALQKWQGNSVRFLSSVPKGKQEMSDSACPQGIQGDIIDDTHTYNMWLDTCRRYGLSNCDQQIQGIQTGRKTLAQVIAEQDKLIAEIAEQYRQQNANRLSVDGSAGEDGSVLPDINMPCPQGIQGEDCARFKLWLENCHRFRFENCTGQLDNYAQGRKTLAQLFEEQDRMINEAALSMQANGSTKGQGGSSDQTGEGSQTDALSSKPLSAAQKLKNAVAVYGSTVMVFHISISLASLGFFYTLVSSGIDVVGLISKLGIGESILKSKLAAGTGTFVVAYAVHKVFAPARIAATLTATPLIVRYLRQIGFLKTPPKKQ